MFLLLQSSLQAWWAVPHKISAKIAYLNLTDETREAIDQIIPNFLEASNWADEVKKTDIWIFDSWHFTNIPYDPESILTTKERNKILMENDATWFLSTIIPFLSKGECPEESKKWLLSILIHVTSDIHQPLHTTSFYSSRFPKGDKGGNRFEIKGMKTKNLHQLWDSALERFCSKDESDATIEKYALSLMSEFPKSSFENLEETNPKAWALESQKIAIEFAYQIPEKTRPSEEYLQKGEKIASKQLVLSGYRLAFVLNQIFDASH